MTLSEYQKLQKDVSGRSGRSRLYRIWDNMLGRCYRRSKGKIYERYGGRGIEVCDEWRKDYLAFAAYSLEKGYDDSLEIDRIDNERGYSPDNCRFVSHRENNRNRRNCRMITYGGKRQCLSAWAEELVINYNTLRNRIRNGWPVERAFSRKATDDEAEE